MSCSDPSFFFSCDDSYLAEDTTVQCRTPENVNNGHHCCKTTTRKGKARPQDFYCFLEKGSPEANYAYCLGLADNPPPILSLKPKPRGGYYTKEEEDMLDNQKTKSSLVPDVVDNQKTKSSLRAPARQKNTESIGSRMKVLLSALIASILCLLLYKKVVCGNNGNGECSKKMT